MILDIAKQLDAKIRAALSEVAPGATITPAGSLRRERPAVNDLDYVILATPAEDAAIRRRIREGRGTTVIQDGRINYSASLADGTRLDLYFAQHPEQDMFSRTPGTYGTILLCRTGSQLHNTYIAMRAQVLKLAWDPYWGLKLGHTVVAVETEAQIYARLHMPYLEPRDREFPQTMLTTAQFQKDWPGATPLSEAERSEASPS